MPLLKNGNKLYHYTSLATALEFILPGFQLLLNPLENTNDPREYKSFVFATKQLDNPDYPTSKHDNERVSELLRDDCKVLCFSDDYENYFGYEYARMWAHYGDNHKGVCLELDKAQFLKENSDVIDPHLVKRLKYNNLDLNRINSLPLLDYTKVTELGLARFLKKVFRPKHLEYLYFQKNEEWKSEREIRVMYFSSAKENEYCSIQESLTNIYLGVDFHDSYLPALFNLIDHKSIDIYRMEYSANVRLTAKPIKATNR